MADDGPYNVTKSDVLKLFCWRHERVLSAISDFKRARGFICWDASTSYNESYRLHKESLYDAFQTGLAFVRTDCSDEWVVCGSGVFAVVRTLERFKELEQPEIVDKLAHVGSMGMLRVYVLPILQMPVMEFYIGCHEQFARGTVDNLPFVVDPPPEQRAVHVEHAVTPLHYDDDFDIPF